MTKGKKINIIINIIAIIILIVLFILIYINFKDELRLLETKEGRDQLIEMIQSTGIFGSIILILIQALQVIVDFIPVEFVEIISGAMFGPILGLIICLIGLNLGTLVIYGLVKLFAINNIKVNNAGEFFSLVNNNDSLALKILDDYTTLLSKMFYNLQLDYNTDCIVLSGGVMKSIDLFFNELKEKTNALVKKYPLKEVNFVFASFDQDAGLFGGVSLALQK